jgi:RecJ-like exonuclease
MTTSPILKLEHRANECVKYLLESESLLCISHVDADGLTSAAIATRALQRAGVSVSTAFSKKLSDLELDQIAKMSYDTVLFTDFGSGKIDKIIEHKELGDFIPVICDHHQPSDVSQINPESVNSETIDLDFHLNPLLFGIDGSTELSGAGTCYALAKSLECNGVDNRDLSALAIIGAVGDMQAKNGGLSGANIDIAKDGMDAGVLKVTRDLSLYGKQTRPLPKLLEYSNEFGIPGISNDSSGSIRFLNNLGMELKNNGKWKTWSDLSLFEKKEIVNELVRHSISRGLSASKIHSFVGLAYELELEVIGTELRDANEFSTVLNSTARYGRPDVGLSVCLGDREEAFARAKNLLAIHRKNLSMGISYVLRDGVSIEENFQWFHARNQIRDTIVGIVAGMVLGLEGTDPNKPIFAFAETEDGDLKVSGRGTTALVENGLNLAEIMSLSAQHVGGEGGGHNIAAGATIPLNTEKMFLEKTKTLLLLQPN